jgi:hypothetical protein
MMESGGIFVPGSLVKQAVGNMRSIGPIREIIGNCGKTHPDGAIMAWSPDEVLQLVRKEPQGFVPAEDTGVPLYFGARICFSDGTV